jgi:3-phosphoshikimate 1-carboxyvinyltransferase
MRLLSGLLPSKNIQATLFGDQSLSRRPMGRIIKPLSEMGVRIKGANEKPPLMITKSEYHSINYKNRIPSAQVKSAVLFAGLGASGITKFSEPFLSRNHTEIMLKNVGANIKTNKNEISISSNSQKLAPLNITVPSDPSTAAFFAGAVAIIPKSNLIINNILTNPTRFGFFTSLKQMGLELDLLSEKSEAGELVSDIFIKHGELKAIEINEEQVPSLIDEIPMLAVIATQAVGKTIIRGARELRVKESDRIESIIFNLKNMGALIEEFEDGFSITGPTKLNGVIIKTFGDHRIAMAFMIASLIATGTTKLDNYECVNISFPEFFDKLKSITS